MITFFYYIHNGNRKLRNFSKRLKRILWIISLSSQGWLSLQKVCVLSLLLFFFSNRTEIFFVSVLRKLFTQFFSIYFFFFFFINIYFTNVSTQLSKSFLKEFLLWNNKRIEAKTKTVGNIINFHFNYYKTL